MWCWVPTRGGGRQRDHNRRRPRASRAGMMEEKSKGLVMRVVGLNLKRLTNMEVSKLFWSRLKIVLRIIGGRVLIR